jgi:hypothetical protein
MKILEQLTIYSLMVWTSALSCVQMKGKEQKLHQVGENTKEGMLQ